MSGSVVAAPRSRGGGRLLAPVALLLGVALGGFARGQGALDPAALVGVWRGVERTGALVISGAMILHPNGLSRRDPTLAHPRTFHGGRWEAAGN